MKKLFIFITLLLVAACQAVYTKTGNKETQLKNLKSKHILVAMWGWQPEILAPSATNHGFEVVVKPGGNNIEQHKKEVPVWAKHKLKMLVRADLFTVKDPFDKKQIKKGCANWKKLLSSMKKIILMLSVM